MTKAESLTGPVRRDAAEEVVSSGMRSWNRRIR